jgi:endonuclease YncB( thermonuclease family)
VQAKIKAQKLVFGLFCLHSLGDFVSLSKKYSFNIENMNLNKKTKTVIAVLLTSLYMRFFGAPHYSENRLVKGQTVVHDGDTIRIGRTKFRLYGMDAPELEQECLDAQGNGYKCGESSREYLVKLIGEATPKCYTREKDKYGRNVGICFNFEGKSINEEMVKGGWAVAYTRYSMAYVPYEMWARVRSLGIWAGSFETPEDFRHKDK